jgi:ABC-type transport system involved in multi-copper enzyme maturation permease subunit
MLADITRDQWITLGLLGAAALVAVIVLLVLAVGLFQARSLIRREFTAYFVSPIAYAVLVVFLAVTGYLFTITFNLLTTTGPKGTEWPLQTMFGDERFWLVFLFIPPLLTMRLFAEERATGTLEVLMTAPLRDWQVVLAKYLACLAFYVVLWLPTLVYVPVLVGAHPPRFERAFTTYSITMLVGLGLFLAGGLMLLPRCGTPWRIAALVLLVLGAAATATGGALHYTRDAEHLLEIPVTLDPYPVLITYLGMFLAGAMFLALGLWVSSLLRDQMVAALIALALGLVFIVAGFWRPEQDSGAWYQAVYFFSVPWHFERAFTRGVLDTRPVVLYASTALFCLFLTVRSLESRRWQ